MRRMSLISILFVLFPAAVAAQDSLTLSADFKAGEVHRFEGKAVATVRAPDVAEQKTETQFAFEMKILSATEEGFTLSGRLTRLSTSDGTLDYPDGTVPEAIRALLDGVGALEYTYDRKWRLKKVGGFGQLLDPLLEGLPQDARAELGVAVDRLVGPIFVALQGGKKGNPLTQPFEKGSLTAGQTWKVPARLPGFGKVEQSFEVVGIEARGERRVANVKHVQELRPGPLARLTGLTAQRTEGTMALLANGLPASARYTQEQSLGGASVTTEIEIELKAGP
ncbi:MAG: hypothetical protein HY720_02110 [Planctomycetes bacterium]|nr:hypothetical protein [Planctomycetota bacterium]